MTAAQDASPAGEASGTDSLAAPRPAAWVLGLWLVAAFLSAMCGIGGGLFAVPLLHYLGGLALQRAVGTSLVLVLVLSSTGTLVELFHAQSALDGPVIALLIGGGYLGTRTGFAVARRLDSLWLKRIFAVVLLASALRLFGLDAQGVDGNGEGLLGLTLLEAGVVLLIGFGGGFVAPLLGVGGGLIVIPALFLSLPGVSYLQARACSTAFSVFASAQAASLHWRAGNVDRGLAWRLALLTAIGSSAGVLAVHAPGWAEGARIAMGMILLFVAGRFTWDVVRARRGSGRPR